MMPDGCTVASCHSAPSSITGMIHDSTGGRPTAGAQVHARYLLFQARNTRFSGANLGLRHIPKETAPDVIAIDRLAPSGPHSSRTLRFPVREPPSGPIHFPLDLIPSTLIL